MGAEDVGVRPGDIIAGKYRVERVLGSGAMGVVVAALHVDLHERRAIKFMLPSMLDDREGVERFLREARSAVRLKSQHVAKIHDIGRLDTGAPYMVMEYLEGQDVKHALDARGALPVHEAVSWMLQVCEAMAEAHQLGIVHRDLKPANLYLTRGSAGGTCVKVLDFGIAKLIGGGDEAVDMTRTSMLLGTPLYMSPEQMRGAKNVDGRSDVWALGAILYRMLTNRTPFVGSSVTEICAAVVADQPDPPAMFRQDVPRALEAAVMRCLEKNPANRFQTASELAAAIGPFASPQAVQAAYHAQASQPSQPNIPPTGAAHAPQPSQPHIPPAAFASAGTGSGAVAVAQTGLNPPLSPALRDAPIDGSLAAQSFGVGNSPTPAVVFAKSPAPASKTPILVGLSLALAAGIGLGVFFFTRAPRTEPAPARADATSAAPTERSEAGIAPATTATPATTGAVASAESVTSAAPSSSAAAAASSAPSATPVAIAPNVPPNPGFAPQKPVGPAIAPTPPTKSTVSYDQRR